MKKHDINYIRETLRGAIARPPESDIQAMIDDGKPLAAGFLSMLRSYQGESAPEEVKHMLRTAFLLGCLHVFGLLSRGVKRETDPETIEKELIGFLVEGKGQH